jgi:hypothetical protein
VKVHPWRNYVRDQKLKEARLEARRRRVRKYRAENLEFCRMLETAYRQRKRKEHTHG